MTTNLLLRIFGPLICLSSLSINGETISVSLVGIHVGTLERHRTHLAPLKLIAEIGRRALPPAGLDRPAAWTVEKHVERGGNLAEERPLGEIDALQRFCIQQRSRSASHSSSGSPNSLRLTKIA